MSQAVQLRALSLGAGVQSTTMALMAAHGEITPMPDCAIFADTGWEPPAVYEHLKWLMSGNVLPFPVHVVSGGDIRHDLINQKAPQGSERRFVSVPMFLKHAKGSRVEHGIGRRQCTRHYKIDPMRKFTRELLGASPRARIPAGAVEKWIGISVDEIIRATPSRIKFETNRFPLIEAGMTRQDCLAWMREQGYPEPPKSACIGCPFHSDAMWRDMRDNHPDTWADAVEVDKAIRTPLRPDGTPKYRAEQFMHAQRVPLDEVDLSTDEDRGQLNMFNHECEGMCGV